MVYCNTNTRVVRRITDNMRVGGVGSLLLQVNLDECLVSATDREVEPEVDPDDAVRRALRGDPEDDADTDKTTPLPADVPLPSSFDEPTYDSDETVDLAGDGPSTPASRPLSDDGWSEFARETEATAQRQIAQRRFRASQVVGFSQRPPHGRGRSPGRSVPQRVPSSRPRGRPSQEGTHR